MSRLETLLATDRLVLRAFRESDLESLVDLDSDPEVMRYLTGGTPTSQETIRDKVLPRFLSYDDVCPAFGYWAAVDKRTAQFIGWFAMHPRQSGPRDVVEIGYRLRRSVWGHGYATEGARALVDHAFGTLQVRQVVANTYEHNVASRRVMEKTGLHLTRRFRPTAADLAASATVDGSNSQPWDGDEVEYSLDAKTWSASVQNREGRA